MRSGATTTSPTKVARAPVGHRRQVVPREERKNPRPDPWPFATIGHRGRAPAPPALASALTRFYALRFAVTAMTMLSAVLLPWLVWSATHRIDLAGLVMLVEAAVRLTMSLYGGQLAHATGGRVSFAGAQALCAAGFALFAAVLAMPPESLPMTFALLAAAIVVMQSGITLGNVVTESCTVALLQSGAADVPARVRVVDLVSTGCALPLGGWLVLAFDAPMAVVALGFALAAGAAIVTARAGGVYDHANARMPARFSLVDRDAWQWLGRNRRARSLTLFLLVASVPVTMLFGALPFLLASRSPEGLPAWILPTDVLFLTHYKALESIGAALILLAWVRWAGATKRKPVAIHTAFCGYVASMIALIAAPSAIGTAIAAIALAASFSPLMVWVRTERAALVPEHNRQRITGLLVAVDATAYVLGALAVRYAGFEPVRARRDGDARRGALRPAAGRAARRDRGSRRCARAAVARREARAPPRCGSPRTATSSRSRLADAIPRLGLVKRATPLPAWGTPLAASPVDAVVPIGVGLTPMVLPRALRDAGIRTSSLAASTEEIAALARPLADLRADALAQGWHPRVLAHLLPVSPREFESRMQAGFHRLRVDTLLRPGVASAAGDASSAVLATRFAPLEVNNGGSQGHWICSSVNHALLAAYGLEGQRIFDRPDALVDDVYEAFVDWLADRMTPRRYAHAFPQGHVPLAFLSGHYSGRMVNDVEGPRIAARIAAHYGVAADYFVGFDDLELGRTLRVRDREMALVKRRGDDDDRSYAVWSDLYVTDSMDHVAASLDSDDAKTRALARAFLRGQRARHQRVAGPRAVRERQGARRRQGERARAPRDAGPRRRRRRAAAAGGAERVLDRRRRRDRREALRRARALGRQGALRLRRQLGDRRHQAVVADAEPAPRRCAKRTRAARCASTIARHRARRRRAARPGPRRTHRRDVVGRAVAAPRPYVASSPGHYVAQARVEPAPFHAMVFDGRRVESFEATADFAAAFTLGWRSDGPHLTPSGTLCRAVPAGHPHTNITTRGALVPVMCEDEFDRLYVALGLHRERASVGAPRGASHGRGRAGLTADRRMMGRRCHAPPACPCPGAPRSLRACSCSRAARRRR